MRRWGIGGVAFCCLVAQGCGVTQASPSVPVMKTEAPPSLKSPEKKPAKPRKPKSTGHEHKAHKPKKHKGHKPKHNAYSAQRIEEIFENDTEGGICNRLDCASNLQIAKSCLPTKASHSKNRSCFHAFCAYGCNEEDYQNNPDVHDFCNRTCSSKKDLER